LPPLVRDAVERARGQDILLFASGLAFYALVSAIPLAIVAAWAAGVILGESRLHQLASDLRRVAPGGLGVGSFVGRIAREGNSAGAVGLITALWPATSYGAGLRRAFDRLSPKRVREARGLRGRGLALIVLLPVFVAGSLLGSYVGPVALGSSGVGRVLGSALALATGFLAAAVGVALIYRIFPPERMPPSSILKGTAFSAAGISLLSLGFTLFLVASGSGERQHFGTMGMALLVLFAVWLFLANAVLLVGYVISLEEG